LFLVGRRRRYPSDCKRCTVIFDELSQGLRDIEYLTDPATGDVRIGCLESLAPEFVPAMIDEFSRRHPQVTFHVTDMKARQAA
jgi:DNA-binding transcriptional LysR family regulator